ncbi:SCAN domain-containing protein 3-like [Cyprinodon tularosa]|uniref:SCAN domain-containing protein 3-like n=1 Tax=Cyprinodon tularosa TaxID=77115 RepID=UPI0018E214E5|nr:SCAN domain-containing protein 3-like [Cyprinodon tularosa]
MALSKKRKVDAENRAFNSEWNDASMFILPPASTKPVCLICSETVALIKSANVKRHYETKHKAFDQSYPPKSELRTQKIRCLAAQYDQSTRVLSRAFSAQQRANECSLRVAWVLGKHKKPFTDASIVKECMTEIAEALLDGKEKDELCDKIEKIPLSACTATRRSEILAQDSLSQLEEAICKALCVGLAVDESTDVSDNAQLLVYIRFLNREKNQFCEDLLGVTPLQTTTKGEDIYLAIKETPAKRGIEPTKVISITTDGAPAMIGREKGAVARFKEDNADLISYHCIIHQAVLCSTLSDEYAEVMKTMIKIINFLRASSSCQHRMLREFLKEVDANSDDLLLHNNVYKEDLQGDYTHFPKVKEQVQGHRDVSSFVDFVDKLIENFSKRFDSFSIGEELTLFIQNPFLITDVRAFTNDVTHHFKWANTGPLQMQMIDLQANVALKEQFARTESTTFWLQMVSETAFPDLKKVALFILTMFGSTYSCEAAFSTMNIIKTKYRSKLTNEHLHMCMRMALTSFKPRFKMLAGQAKAQFSH